MQLVVNIEQRFGIAFDMDVYMESEDINLCKVLKQVDYAQNGAINILGIPFQDYINAFFSPDLERILKEEKKKDVKYRSRYHEPIIQQFIT